MKSNLLIGFSFLLSLLSSSCVSTFSSGTSYFSVEKILEKSVYGMGRPVQYSSSEPTELGITFVTHKEGKIIGLHIKNPELGNKRVSLWDANERQLLATYNFTITDAQKDNFFQVDIPLEKGRTYTITMNCSEFYYVQFYPNPMPFSNEEITLLNSVYLEGTWQQYPIYKTNEVIHGLFDFDFQWKIQ